MPERICIDLTDARGFVLAADGRAQELLPGAGRARHRAQLLSYFDTNVLDPISGECVGERTQR